MNTSCCAKISDALDLRHVLSYPITEVPLSLAHSDGTLLKTEKATLTKTLESRQETVITSPNLVKVSACHGEQIHLVLDKYQSPSIKDSECILHY